jgi:hypothetical protein
LSKLKVQQKKREQDSIRLEIMTNANIHFKTSKRKTFIGLDFFPNSKLSTVLFLLLNVWCLHSVNDSFGKAEAYNVIRVCQNKHCCKRTNADVLQNLHNLVDTGSADDDIIVEGSGCLSQCDKGPNVEISTKSGTVLLNGMIDAQTCAFQLGEVSSSTPSFPPIPKILIAASKVIEQSHKLSANEQFQEEIRFLTSVIDKLEISPAVNPSTSANADAHALRAQARLYLARNEKRKGTSDRNGEVSGNGAIAGAISDARRVVQELSAAATPASLSLAYRTWTDAELFLAEEQQEQEQQKREIETSKNRDFSRVVAVLTEWYRAQPMYRTKLQGEIQGLLLNM